MLVSNDMTRDSRVDRHAKALGARGHEVIVLARASSNRQPGLEDREFYVIRRYREPLLGVRAIPRQDKISQLGTSSHTHVGALFRFLKATRRVAVVPVVRLWLYRLACSIHADVYHCNDLDTLDVGATMKIVGKKVVYDSHELYVEEIAWKPLRAVYFALERLLVKLTDVIMTVNPFIAKELQRRYQIKTGVRVVLNCPEVSPEALPRPAAAHHRELTTVLYHGGLYPERGLENLVIACAHLKKGVRLILRGDGEVEGRLKELASGLDNIVFERSVPMDSVVEAASSADIGVIAYLPTNLNHYYCSPNKLFEYMQAGLAVAASDFPFLREVIMGHAIGVVFNPEDPEDIADKINYASEPSNLSDFRRNVQKVRRIYTWEYERTKLYSAYAALENPSLG